jgi:steroid 5-alpha reductase family enzyme
MLKTIFLLLFAVIVIPIVAFKFGDPLEPAQKEMLMNMTYLMIGVASTCFVLSLITDNCSQVDKLWSVIPMVYVWYFAYKGGFDPRMTLMAVLVTIWAVRLTYNFGRRGGYSWKFWTGEEDYRWEVLKKNPALSGKIRWTLFNLFFISFYQLTLIFLFTLPAVVAWQGKDKPLGIWDLIVGLVMIGLIVIETIGDQQQYNYQTEKYRRKNAGEALGDQYAKGFIDTGLWGKVRHPNYASEQSIWIAFYLFSVIATGTWINWSLAGAVLLVILFQGSADFSENISLEKYPLYKDYIKRVPRFIPKFW